MLIFINYLNWQFPTSILFNFHLLLLIIISITKCTIIFSKAINDDIVMLLLSYWQPTIYSKVKYRRPRVFRMSLTDVLEIYLTTERIIISISNQNTKVILWYNHNGEGKRSRWKSNHKEEATQTNVKAKLLSSQFACVW